MTASRVRARVCGVVGLCLLTLLVATGCNKDKKLKVTGISPNKGDYLGGQVVEVTGNRFQTDDKSDERTVRSVKVYFGGAQAHVRRFAGDDQLILVAPGGKIGETVDVKFYFEPGGVLTVPKAFTFVEQDSATVDDLHTGEKEPTKK